MYEPLDVALNIDHQEVNDEFGPILWRTVTYRLYLFRYHEQLAPVPLVLSRRSVSR